MRTKYFFLDFVFAIILSLIIWFYYTPLHLPLTKTVYRIDALIKISPPKTIKIERTKVKIKYVRATFILEKPFVASLDTVIGSDSLSAKYFSPINEMSIDFRHTPDTTKISILLTQQIEKKNQ